jgi:2-amino-4-hydroxy-6-hydroxymethyldihydropteridine diphosphokinase
VDVYVAAGSNSDPVLHLRAAVAALERVLGPLRCSAVYRSPAFGTPAPDYLNLAAAFAYGGGPDALKAELVAIEAAAGRGRGAPRSAACALDLDLVLHGRRVDGARRLPHDDALVRAYVLAPLAEIAPGLEHPLTGEPFALAWERFASDPASGPHAARLTKLGPLISLD